MTFQTGLTGADGNLLADALLDRGEPPTAVILIFEAAAVRMYERLSERGRRPGHDLSIIGLRNDLVVQHLRPRLTCFDLSLFDVGAALGDALLAQIAGHAKQVSHTQVRISMALRARESDGPVARSAKAPVAKRRSRMAPRVQAETP